jgi:TFIIF-interacting CTD phosphatase-like protein
MKSVVLDLDNTLLFTFDDFNDKYDYILDFGDEKMCGVWRPYLKEFLIKLYKNFDVYVWSAGEYEYVHKIVKLLNKIIPIPKEKVLTRDDCIIMKNLNGDEIRKKPLSLLFDKFPHLNYKNTLIIDDRYDVCEENLCCHIQIKEFNGSKDNELKKLIKNLIKYKNEDDVCFIFA